jgi:PAS domain S-box-containing protein
LEARQLASVDSPGAMSNEFAKIGIMTSIGSASQDGAVLRPSVSMKLSTRSLGYDLLFAAAAVAGAVVIRLVMRTLVGQPGPFAPFLAATAIAAWNGGLRPGLIATGLGVCVGLFLSGLGFGLDLGNRSVVVSACFSSMLGICISIVCESLHRARQRIEYERRLFEIESGERRYAQSALAESENRYRTLVELSPQVVWMATIDGANTYANQCWFDYTGLTSAETDGRGWLSAVEPNHVARFERAWQPASGTPVPWTIEVPLRRGLDGAYRWHVIRAMPIMGPDGTIDRWIGIAADIHDRKQAAQMLADANSRLEERMRLRTAELVHTNALYRAIYDQGAFAGLIDVEGTVLDCNRSALETCGFRREEMVGKLFWETGWWNRPDLQAWVRAGFEQAVGGQAFHGETPYFTADGGERRVDFALLPINDEAGRLSVVMATGIDVTERREAESQRRDLEAARAVVERFRLMAEALPQQVFTTTPSGAIEYVNPQWAEYTGLSAANLADWNWNEIVHPDDLSSNVNAWRQAIAHGAPFGLEQRLRRADGQYRWHITRAVPIRDPQGQITQWLGSCTDVQDMKEADRRKDEFLAVLAHELRNPLAPLRHGLELLNHVPHGDPAADEVRGMMDRQLTQMVHLIDDLLDVNRISQGKIVLERERLELRSIVETSLELVRPMVEKAGHELVVELPDEPVWLLGDATRLSQIFSNLLANSAKYSERGGRIVFGARVDGPRLVVSVRDTGIGIPPAMLERIFELFAQVDRSLEKSQGGLGIGLTLVKRLVELHGGTVEAHSAGPGRGSEFVVGLPRLVEADCPAEEEGSTETPRRDSKLRILVVDDNRDAAESLAMMLKLWGHETSTAFDGLAAQDAAEAFRPDVILLDIGMPVLNGYDACRRLRTRDWARQVAIVALTGWGQEDDRQRSREAGFDHHLVKPVDTAELNRLLAEVEPQPA